jgi:hypothetical protein
MLLSGFGGGIAYPHRYFVIFLFLHENFRIVLRLDMAERFVRNPLQLISILSTVRLYIVFMLEESLKN